MAAPSIVQGKSQIRPAPRIRKHSYSSREDTAASPGLVPSFLQVVSFAVQFRHSAHRCRGLYLPYSLRLDFPAMVPVNGTESQLPPKFRRMIHNGDSSGLSTSHNDMIHRENDLSVGEDTLESTPRADDTPLVVLRRSIRNKSKNKAQTLSSPQPPARRRNASKLPLAYDDSLHSSVSTGRLSVQERYKVLRADPDIQKVQPLSVVCRRCSKTVSLGSNPKKPYYRGLWNTHKQRCNGIQSNYPKSGSSESEKENLPKQRAQLTQNSHFEEHKIDNNPAVLPKTAISHSRSFGVTEITPSAVYLRQAHIEIHGDTGEEPLFWGP